VHPNRRVPFACVSLAFVALQLGRPVTLAAQAWVPAPGEGSVSFTYQNYDVAGHFDVHGHENTNGGTRSQALVTDVDYGIAGAVGFTVSLPFIASKYTGPPSYSVGGHLTVPGPLDDGSYHGAFQDVRIEARRLWLAGPLAVAPFAGATFPTHDYETIGEAVPGRHRRDFQVGASAGADLNPVLRRAYIHVRYSYATAQRIQDHPFTRSNIDIEGGWAATSRVGVRGLLNGQIRHKGPALAELEDDWVHHDRFIAPSYLITGGGASISMTESTDVYALWVVTVSGSNGAHRARTLAVGMTVGFGSGIGGLGGLGGSAVPTRPAIRGPINAVQQSP
jgi:hypothetical protein